MNDDAIQRAMNAIEEDRIEEAISILEPLAKGYEPEPDVLVYLGISYVQADRPKDAITVLRRAQEMVEDHCVVALFLGRALRGVGQLEEAEEELQRAINLEPDEPENWSELGKLLYDRGSYREAARILEEALLLFPEDLSLRGTYALTLYRLGDFTQATIEWDTIHQLNPSLMTAKANYAYTLLLQDKIDEATPIVESAYSDHPTDYRALVLMGILSLSHGDKKRAWNFFEQVLESDSENVQALSHLAVLCYENGDIDKCNRYLNLAEMQMESSSECLRGLCYAYSEIGWKDRQMECLLKWTKNDPYAAAPWIALAVEYDKNGNKQEAIKAWKKTIELRGYIRINCKNCGQSIRYDLDQYPEINPYEPVHCGKCKATIQMPQGFLTF